VNDERSYMHEDPPGPNWRPGPHPHAEAPRDDGATDDERLYAVATHASSLLFLIGEITLLISLVAGAVLWLVKKDQCHFLDDHGREAVNFQLSQALYAAVFIGVSVLVTVLTFGLGAIIALPVGAAFLLVLLIVRLVFSIKAMIAAHRGEYFRYPATLRFIPPADANGYRR